MSVLISMKIPDKCGHCRFADAFDCSVDKQFIPTHNERRYDCPLVPVPPHGDLIDRNELEHISWKADEVEDSFDAGILFVLERIDEMPTIIPAEPEEECEA